MQHDSRRASLLSIFLVSLFLGAAALGAAPHPAPLESASSGGLEALDRALARLMTHQRLLVIAAHPDDEDTRILTLVSRGLGGEAAYLSLSRGDGGQNLIGPELGVGLGLLRSRELLAARQIDGARQFFTRAYDFGYTRSLAETFERWPREVLLEDAARVVRRFKPQVIVAVFPPSARAGHGQHWASGVIADEIYELAGDPGAFPGLADEGLVPWRPAALYRSAFFNRAAATLEMPLGTLDPWSGRSIFQVSLRSRSQHRCQDMGLILPLGEASGALAWQKGGAGPDGADLFAGVDTRLAAIAELLENDAERRAVAERLERVAELAQGARRGLNAVTPGNAAAPLVEIVRLLRRVEADLGDGDDPGRVHVRDLLREKRALAEEALATAAGVVADAYTERETVVPGELLRARTVFWNAGAAGADVEVGDLEVGVESFAGWRLVEHAVPEEERSFFSTTVTDERDLVIQVPADAAPTVPYFLRRPLRGDLYDWRDAPPAVRGEPFAPPPLRARFAFTVDGVPVELLREVVYRYRDQARGEVRRPLRAVPRLEVEVEPELLAWPIGEKKEHVLRLAVRSNVDEPVRARLEIDGPEGFTAAAPEVEIADAHGRRVVEVRLAAPADLAPGRHVFSVAAIESGQGHDGQRYDHAYPLIDYEHIRPTPLPRPARLEVSAGDIRLPSLERVAYLRGASDRVPEFLRQVGVPLEVLSASELEERDFTVYDAIVVGSRAYESDPDLGRLNPRLLDYARSGGLVVVQYQQYQFSRGEYAPYPLEIDRPHDRVTDETAPVRILEPAHPVLNVPNRIGDADWEGWVQERGLYFAGTWSEEYQPLLAMADPNNPDDPDEKRGALLVAEVGDGHWVYSGLAFFRQFPAGAPGAYRLFANLLALGQTPEDG